MVLRIKVAEARSSDGEDEKLDLEAQRILVWRTITF